MIKAQDRRCITRMLLKKCHPHIVDVKLRLINNNLRKTVFISREGNHPWAFADTQMLIEKEEQAIPHHREDKGDQQMAGQGILGGIRIHASALTGPNPRDHS